ncbi:MAG: TIGR02452 family protein [Chlamydiae bacterium]|nr:TIGR02452 family protein [Chlamydiota bacterium]
MLEKISSYLQSYFTEPTSAQPSSPSRMYTNSFSSMSKERKGLVVVLGALTVGIIIYLWRSKWNPSQGFSVSKDLPKKGDLTKFLPHKNVTQKEATNESSTNDVTNRKESINENGEIRGPTALETKTVIDQRHYIDKNEKTHFLKTGEQLLANSEFFPNTTTIFTSYKFQTTIEVVNQDCLEVAEKEAKTSKTAVLMFASPLEPGGGMSDDSIGQEEDLCLRSDIFGFMWDQVHVKASKQLYPLVDLERAYQVDPHYAKMKCNGMIHTPNVTVFRAAKEKSYEFLCEPFQVGMLISPAPCWPKLTMKEETIDYTRKEDRAQMKKLITTQLTVACQKGYETVVLGAFGCGSFKNPPETVAKLYKEIIDAQFKGAFKKIVFAILDDSNKGEHNPTGNLKPFEECFKI